jgi:hypothetical protein
MLTYQLQPRTIRFRGDPPVFPSPATVELVLKPAQLFGGVEGPSRILVLGSDRHLEFNANTGRDKSWSSPPLLPVNVTAKWRNAALTLKANRLACTFDCDSLDDLRNTVAALFYLAPISISQLLPDPAVVTRAEGRVGSVEFGWEHARGSSPALVATQELIEGRFARSLERLDMMMSAEKARLTAALHYLHVAKRLWTVPESPWEFASEVLLNFAKALEILFGQARDEVRAGLGKVRGLDPTLIERVFIPVLLLRSHLDVAHSRLARIDLARRTRLYEFVAQLEGHFGTLLEAVIDSVQAGELQLKAPTSLELSAKEQAELDTFLLDLGDNLEPPA